MTGGTRQKVTRRAVVATGAAVTVGTALGAAPAAGAAVTGSDPIRPMRLPPGVSREDFVSALNQFRGIVGAEWVFSDPADLDTYRDFYSPFRETPEERVCSAAVAPTTVEQVQAIARVCNALGIPIYPISTGKNLGYGGSAPALSGSVVLDLKRMNRVLEVNEECAFALVEPGVNYMDLYAYIRERGLKLWIDCPSPGWGSPLGNAVDRGVGYTRDDFRNHFEAHCGMEVVLADGDIVRTGMGAMPGAKTWQQYKGSFGPSLDGLFCQSNFGIVTKMGFWLMPEPEAYSTIDVGIEGYEDIEPFITILNHLQYSRVFNGMPEFAAPLFGVSLVGPQDSDPAVIALLHRPEGPALAEIRAAARRTDRPCWACKLQFYGSESVIAAQIAEAKRKFAALPGATITDGETLRFPLTDSQLAQILDPTPFGVPSLNTFNPGIGPMQATDEPQLGHIFFSPIVARTGSEVLKANQVLGQACRERGLPMPPVLLPAAMWERSFLLAIAFPVTASRETNDRMLKNFGELARIAAANGWGEYRTAPGLYDEIMATYSFNDHALLRLNERIKDAVDPRGILSAGRYGIYPKHLRKTS